jgi:dihydropteroate synthase
MSATCPIFAKRKIFTLCLRSGPLTLGKRTLIMGVLNVTPDSFSDGGQFFKRGQAVSRALEIEDHGADILDIGGESTRPGSAGTSDQEELRRIEPLLAKLASRIKIPISIDTRKARVAALAVEAGAQIVNDVSGFQFDPGMPRTIARLKVPVILMHMRGEPETMQKMKFASNVIRDVTMGLRRSISLARAARIKKSQIIIDPGIGFGKSFSQNFELLANLPTLAKLGYPLMIGTSRKGFLGHVLGGKKANDRIWATASTVTASILAGAHIVRVHDVKEMVEVARTTDALIAANS